MSFVVPELVEPVKAFATALGIGLLIGMERERRPDSAAGLRTFSLVAMLGCLFALLDDPHRICHESASHALHQAQHKDWSAVVASLDSMETASLKVNQVLQALAHRGD